MLSGRHERVVVVAVGRPVHGAHLPAFARHVVVRHLLGLRRAEGAGVHEREVRRVEEVVGELHRAHRRAPGLVPRVGARGVVPLGELVQVADGGFGGQPHQAVALGESRRGSQAGARRQVVGPVAAGAERRDAGGLPVGTELPPVVRAHDAVVHHAAGAERSEAVGATVDEGHDPPVDAREHPVVAEQPDPHRVATDLGGHRDRVPAPGEGRGLVVDCRVVDRAWRHGARIAGRGRAAVAAVLPSGDGASSQDRNSHASTKC